eukprot:6202713-Pleurochrysis_carterae.AAC.1
MSSRAKERELRECELAGRQVGTEQVREYKIGEKECGHPYVCAQGKVRRMDTRVNHSGRVWCESCGGAGGYEGSEEKAVALTVD